MKKRLTGYLKGSGKSTDNVTNSFDIKFGTAKI